MGHVRVIRPLLRNCIQIFGPLSKCFFGITDKLRTERLDLYPEMGKGPVGRWGGNFGNFYGGGSKHFYNGGMVGGVKKFFGLFFLVTKFWQIFLQFL